MNQSVLKLPTVAIVIPVYNEEDIIAKCLDACVAQTSLPDEIIIVNNNSTDGTAGIVKHYQRTYPNCNIRILNEAEQGIVPARDRGFKAAKSEILGRIDADSIISPEWVMTVRHVFAESDIAASTGPVTYYDMPLSKVGFAIDEKIRKNLHRWARDHRFLFGSNMAIRKSAWERISSSILKDHEDLYHEDINLALTLFENDLEITYEPAMVGGMSARRIDDSPRDFYRYVMRFERTFKAHKIKSTSARIPIFIYLLIYFPVRTIRLFYDGGTNRFTLKKLRVELGKIKL